VAHKFDPKHADHLENPDRLVELPPAKLVELLRLSGTETLIDFGAGTGLYSVPVAEALPKGRVLAVDEQPELLDRLRDKLQRLSPPGHIEPILSRDGHVPLPDAVAERMLLINVLHHVHDEPETLIEMSRLLAPDGLLVMAEFAQMDRPVGPTNDHVLPLDEVRAHVTGLGLRELKVYGPGEIGLYHNVIVAQRPAS
jgi:ubiquinone/menaquinone biosynthesis C-methylase UbiE